ncbi:MAG: phenylacetate--CoA ligase family protein [Casimicrobiaceae bacterium]
MVAIRDESVLAIEHAHTLRQLWRHRPASPAALREFQLRKLRVLVAHCRRHVAAYREHWRGCDLDPADISRPEDIAALPAIGKTELRSRPVGETLVDGARLHRLVRHRTSGSSGQPFTIYRSQREEHLLNLFRLRAAAGAGVRLFDRIVRFSQLPLGGPPRRWPGSLRQGLGIHCEESLDGLAPGDEMADRLARSRADVVRGYPSMLLRIAACTQQRARHRVPPRLILSGGEVLQASARRTIEAAFSAPLVDFYGAHEFNLLAWQCPAGDGYHVCDDNVLVEIVDDAGRAAPIGEPGEVVATALHSYTMPFVRYRTGDIAVRGDDRCGCGLAFSTLRAIQGRAVDYLHLPEGRRLHPYAVTGHLAEREAEWISQHQLVQTGTGHVVLKIQPARTPKPGDVERLRAFGAGILGARVQFDVALVDRFPSHPSGKFHPYVSLHAPAPGLIHAPSASASRSGGDPGVSRPDT